MLQPINWYYTENSTLKKKNPVKNVWLSRHVLFFSIINIVLMLYRKYISMNKAILA